MNRPAETELLTPYTVTAGTTRAYRVCWICLDSLEPGTAAFTDGSAVVCSPCAAHCTACADPDCAWDHPPYAHNGGSHRDSTTRDDQ